MPQIMITYHQILDKDPCVEGWAKLLLAKDLIDQEAYDSWLDNEKYDAVDLPEEPFPVSDILETNNLDDTLWVLRCLPEQNNLWRKYAWWCADQVKHLTDDQRVHECLDVVWRHTEGRATNEELREAAWAAEAAAREAARAAREAWAAEAAARAAVWAAREAGEAARAAGAAAWAAEAAARAAVWAAREAAWAAEAAARAAVWAADAAARAAGAAARAAAREKQANKLKQILESGEFKL